MAPRKKRFKIPKVTSPPTRYEVWWVDANFDNEYDGIARDFKPELLHLPHVGYHTHTTRDTIALAGEAQIEEDGLHVRDIMTLPRVHIYDMKPLFTEEEFRAREKSSSSEVGSGRVPGLGDVKGQVQ